MPYRWAGDCVYRDHTQSQPGFPLNKFERTGGIINNKHSAWNNMEKFKIDIFNQSILLQYIRQKMNITEIEERKLLEKILDFINYQDFIE